MAPLPSVRLLYVRHGGDPADPEGPLPYHLADQRLTAAGRDQAAELARELAQWGRRFDREIVSAPSTLATETAGILADKLGLAVTTDEGLREIDVGNVDRRTDDEAREIYVEVQRRWAAGEWSHRFPGGENLRMLTTRLRAALIGAAARASRRPETQGGRLTPPVLVVGHGTGFRAALPYLVANIADAYPHDDLTACSVTVLEATPAARPSVLRLQRWGLPHAGLGELSPGVT